MDPLQALNSTANLLKESNAMKLKRWCLVISMVMATSLVMSAPVISAASSRDFRQKNGLQIYVPPDWFLNGYFIAREKNPGYVFGPVRKFAKTLGGTTTWLIEDMELERLEAARAEGKKIEYSLYLEAVSSDRTEYWVFVALPYDSAQMWYDARRAYHGRKAKDYYGKTRDELERAQDQGLNVSAELRFWIENGETSLKVPEDVIMNRYKFRPVFDLDTGRRPNPTANTD
ncbi:MAG: hypothetical protein WBY47_17875 [Desulfobacterales bacterium]|jgi:hypothetical protein